MALLMKFVRQSLYRRPAAILRFPTSGFETVDDKTILEEEQFDEFNEGKYYPVNIGDVYHEKYQVLGKLGFGTTSTVWLAHNFQERTHVALKIYTKDRGDYDELKTYDILAKTNPKHPGYGFVRTALDSFQLDRPGGGTHQCLVQKPLWDSWKGLLRRNPTGRFTEELLKGGLARLFLALDYLHSECKIVHTDIKLDNILHELVDKSVIDAFTRSELESPSPRKLVDGKPVYASRRFDRPKRSGDVVLGDFGAAVRGDERRNHDAQPNVYRSPEVMLKTEWSYPVDIWNVGVMIWDLFQGRHLFNGQDPDGTGYSTRAHLAEVVGLLGPPPLDLLQRGKRSAEFFAEDGSWRADVEIPSDTTLENSIQYLEDDKKAAFLTFIRGLLQWRPEDRKTAAQLCKDPWIWS